MEENLLVGIDGRPAQEGARVVKRSMQDVERSATSATTTVEKLDKQLGLTSKSMKQMKTAALGFAAAFTLSIATAQIATFDKAMSKVKALSQATSTEMAELSKQARLMGASTAFSASQAAAAQAELAAAGFKTYQVVAALPDVLNLAAAGELAMAEAASITASTLAQFQLAATDAARVSDVFAKAAAAGTISVTEIGEALKYVAPVAHSAGMSLEETVAAVTVLKDSGLAATQAGNGLQNAIARLLNPTKDTVTVLTEMGLKLEDVDVRTHSFASILATLKDRGIDAQRALKAFGDVGGVAILSLTNAVDQANPKLQTLQKELENSSGAAKEMATVMQDNLAGDISNLQSGVEELFLMTGDAGLAKALRAATQGATNFLQGLVGIPAELDKMSLGMVAAYKSGEVLGDTLSLIATVGTPALVALGSYLAGTYLGILLNWGKQQVVNLKNFAAEAVAVRQQKVFYAELAAIKLSYAKAEVAAAESALLHASGVAKLAVVEKQLLPAQTALVAAEKEAVVASQAATAATSLKARALTGLKGLLAALGGPLGLITLAATALFMFASNARSAKDKTEELKAALSQLGTEYDKMTTKQLGATRSALEKVQQDLQKERDRLNRELQTGRESGLFGGDIDQEGYLQKRLESAQVDKNLIEVRKELTSVTQQLMTQEKAAFEREKEAETFKLTWDQLREMRLARRKTSIQQTQQEIALSTEELDQLRQITEGVDKAAKVEREYGEQLDFINGLMAKNAGSTKELQILREQVITQRDKELQQIKDEANGTKETAAALQALQNRLDPLAALQKQYTEDKKLLVAQYGEEHPLVKALTKEYDKNKKALTETADGTKDLAEQTKRLREQYDPAYAATQAYTDAQVLLKKAVEAGIVTQQQALELLDKMAKAQAEAGKKAEQGANAYEEAWKSMIQRLDGLFVDLWESAFDGGTSFMDGLKSAFKRMLAEMMHAAVTRPFVSAIGNMFSGGGQGGGLFGMIGSLFGGASGSTGGNDLGSTIGNLGSTIMSLFGGGATSQVATGISTAVSSAVTTTSVAGGAASAAAGTSAAAGGASSAMAGFAGIPVVGWIMMGMAINSDMYDKGWQAAGQTSDILKYLMKKTGPFLTGIIGGVLGADSLLRKIGVNDKTAAILSGSALMVRAFGHQRPKIRDSGMNISFANGQISSTDWFRIRQKGGWFRSDRNWTETRATDDKTVKQMQKSYEAMLEPIRAWAKEMDLSTKFLDNFTQAAKKISLKGKSKEEIAEILEEFLRDSAAAAMEAFVSRTEGISALFKKVIASFHGDSEELMRAFAAMATFTQLASKTIGESATEYLADLNSTQTEKYKKNTEALLELLEDYDGSIESLEELSNAYAENRAMAVELAAALMQTKDALTQMFDSTRNQIEESLLNDEQLYGRWQSQVDMLVSQLNQTTDPGQMMSLGQQINELIGQMYGVLTEDQQGTMAQGFLDFLDQIDALIAERTDLGLGELEDHAGDTTDAVTATLAESVNLYATSTANFGSAVSNFGAIVDRMGGGGNRNTGRSEVGR